MMLLMGSILAIFQAGARYYIASTKTVELQQACLVSANRLSTEMGMGDLTCIDDQDTLKQYVTFSSPLTQTGEVNFSLGGGVMLWQSFVCYYTKSVNGNDALMRNLVLLNPPQDAPPQVPAGLGSAYFRALTIRPEAPYPPQLIAQNIYYLDVTRTSEVFIVVGARDPYHEFLVSVQTTVQPKN